MFGKLVSGLPFSPALVGQLGFYAKRLKKEEATRRLGLVFTALALVVQSFAVFSPPEPANAASAADIIYGGVSSVQDILAAYDNPSKDFKKIVDYYGITRAELAATKSTVVNTQEFGKDADAWKSLGRIPFFSPALGEVSMNIGGTTYYTKPMWRFDTSSYASTHGSTRDVFRGWSAKMGHFAIQKACGNIWTTKVPTPPAPVVKNIQVCRPNVGVITIKETDKRSTDLPATSPTCQPKNIQVCRPGTGVITIKETDKRTTDLPADSDLCKPKVAAAACSSLEVKKIERTKFTFTATAQAQNGATVSKYTFVIKKKDANGVVVATKTITSTALTADSGTMEFKDASSYSVQVTVTTSLGEKTGANCTTAFTVIAPEKCAVNPELLATDKDCQPCPGNPELWYKSPDCQEKVASAKSAINLTQNGANATSVTANGGDRIQFTLSLTNTGKVAVTMDFKEHIDDTLEYATIHDNGGANLVDEAVGQGQKTKVLSWGSVSLKPGEKVSRTFTAKVLDTIPLTARGTSNSSSYDCIVTNTFGNTLNIAMNCPTVKTVETVVQQLPSTGPTENIIFSGVVAAVVMYFYARSRQLGAEVRLVRKDFNTGTL